jgi:hypothetical protein
MLSIWAFLWNLAWRQWKRYQRLLLVPTTPSYVQYVTRIMLILLTQMYPCLGKGSLSSDLLYGNTICDFISLRSIQDVLFLPDWKLTYPFQALRKQSFLKPRGSADTISRLTFLFDNVDMT